MPLIRIKVELQWQPFADNCCLLWLSNLWDQALVLWFALHSSLMWNSLSFFKDFTVYIDGDLLLAIIAAIGAAFFFFVYQGITLGRKRRRKRRSMHSNVKGHKNDLQKSSEYWTEERSKELLQHGKIHDLYKQNDATDKNFNKIFCIML